MTTLLIGQTVRVHPPVPTLPTGVGQVWNSHDDGLDVSFSGRGVWRIPAEQLVLHRSIEITAEEAAICLEWIRWYCSDVTCKHLPHDPKGYRNEAMVDWPEDFPDGWEAVYEKLAAVTSKAEHNG